MKHTASYKIFSVAFWFLGLIAIGFEILNPHSFLSAAGAFYRIIFLSILAIIWILFCHRTGRATFNSVTILLGILIAAYFATGLSLHCQNFAYENHVSDYRCPAMLF